MGYRNETEQLRAKVDQLEGQLAAIRGERQGAHADVFAQRVRRQKVLVLCLALLGSAGMCLCAVPTIGVTLDTPRMTPAELAETAPVDLSREVRLVGTLDAAESQLSGEYDGFAPMVGEPRVLVYCGWECPYRVSDEIRARRASPSRTYAGRVQAARPGLYVGQLDPDELEAYAAAHQLRVDELRVVTIREGGDGVLPLWVMLGMVVFGALGLWLALLWHGRATRADVPLASGADYQLREPAIVLVLTIVTCGVYQLVWLYQTTAQIRRLTGRPDLVPGLDVALAIATFGLWPYWAFYRNAEAVDEALVEMGEMAHHRSTVVGLILGSFACGLLHWVLLYKLQEAYNRLIVERSVDV